eukprot:EG_transcript_8568
MGRSPPAAEEVLQSPRSHAARRCRWPMECFALTCLSGQHFSVLRAVTRCPLQWIPLPHSFLLLTAQQWPGACLPIYPANPRRPSGGRAVHMPRLPSAARTPALRNVHTPPAHPPGVRVNPLEPLWNLSRVATTMVSPICSCIVSPLFFLLHSTVLQPTLH